MDDAWEIQFIEAPTYDVTYIEHTPQHMDLLLGSVYHWVGRLYNIYVGIERTHNIC